MIKLFDVIDPKFFNVLSSPNKIVYVECIFIIYDNLDNFEDSFQGDKEAIVDKLVSFFDELNDEAILKDDNNKELPRSSRDKAYGVINYLKECGWLGEEPIGNWKVSLFFYEYAIRQIDLLKKITLNEETEYSGYIFTIWSILNNFDVKEGIGIIETAYEKTNDLILRLKTLKANIYRFYNDFSIQKKESAAAKILEDLFGYYKSGFFDRAYMNLMAKDNISKYTQEIKNAIFNIKNTQDDELMDDLTNQLLAIKKFSEYNHAYNYLDNKLNAINHSFEALNDLMSSITNKNHQYLKAVTDRVMFLKNRDSNIEGAINLVLDKLIKTLKTDEPDTASSELFRIYLAHNLSVNSFYVNRKKPEKLDSVDYLPDENYDNSDLINESIMNISQIEQIPTSDAINKYVLELLGDNDSLSAEEVPLDDPLDFLNLLLIYNYSTTAGVDYYIIQRNDKVQKNKYIYINFDIKRRSENE